ncbi:taurine ABC transporter substrate-binding protein [Pectinatus haikarae]|uniref:Taurine transport system substrate-binding protein n=1 Tax=Pectinatus haikarae TaxID=349096 RepID=A0ABT9Y3P3_9FIRM|nr:aliphatic sulfonate ABC transporter substrate-binding protein [Pectinatus haikarae]MDQ0202445.1 taurine transport system substrate-binding protein [Pectinatus haikarae]
MKNKLSLSFMVLVIMSLLFAGCGNNQAAKNDTANETPESITIGLQAIPNDELVAKQWYEKELGVKVNFKQFDSGRDVNTAMTAGSIDIAILGSTPAAIGIAKGIPYEVFWIHDVEGDNEALAVKNSAGVNSIKDLKGKKIAVPSGSTTHYSLLNALKLEGINQGDVRILDMQPPEIFAAWQRGDIDAAYVWQPTLGKLLNDGKLLVTSRELAQKGIVTADVGIVRTEFAQKCPDIVKKYVQLQEKAFKLYSDKSDEAAQSVASELKIDQAESLKEMKELLWLSGKDQLTEQYLGTSSKKGDFVKTLKDTADFLVEQKAIDSVPEIAVFEKAVNPAFIEAATK